MAGLADWLEDYRNWRGRQEWEQGKGWQDFFGGDPRAQEQFEKLSGFGTDAGGLVGMIRASHGSPHAFTKFDFSKIGTGEGAQAYGHGGYFAQGFDSPVAQEYRDVLSESTLMHNGNPVNAMDDSPKANALKAIAAQGYEPSLKRANEMLEEGADPVWMKKYIQELDALKNDDIGWKTGGHLYNVELRWPDAAREAADPLGEHHLLDWDAPLSEQPATVQKAWEKFLGSKAAQSADRSMRGDLFEKRGQYATPTGADIYGALTEGLIGYGKPRPFMQVKQEASERLRKVGIPGIRYLDQASRGAGEGTRNYVMFDDALANIVSRNGVSLSDLLRR